MALPLLFMLYLTPLHGKDIERSEWRGGEEIMFTVSDLNSGEELCRGIEYIQVQDGQVIKDTRYFDEQGRFIQVEHTSYAVDSLQLQAYQFHNNQTETEVKLETADDIAAVSVRTPEGERDGRFTWTDNTFMAKPLHHLILRNWDTLLQKQDYRFRLMVPSKVDAYKFRIRLIGTTDRDGQRLQQFRLEPESWFIRKMVKPMDFFYSAEQKLVQYEGVTTVNLDGNADRLVRIDFTYAYPEP